MASPNTVMTIEPVRDGSRFNWSMMRASGCDIRDAYRVLSVYDNVQADSDFVMAGLVPAIHVFLAGRSETWMPGTSPGMTEIIGVGAYRFGSG
jgi:hypothetical protein